MANVDIGAAGAPGASVVREVLARVQESKLFCASQRQSDLLAYLVNEEIEGRGDRLKSYSIAIDVFGRGADFDPASNSTVRVEMHRLRQALMLFNATEGQGLAATILLEPGAYRPQFIWNTDPSAKLPADLAPPPHPPDAPIQPGADIRPVEISPPAPALRRSLRILAAAGVSAAVVASITMLAFRHGGPASHCDFDRPTVRIAIDRAFKNEDRKEFEFLRDRLYSALQLYPLVVPIEHAARGCGDAPAFELTLDKAVVVGAEAITLSLSKVGNHEILWTRAYPAPKEKDIDGMTNLIARLAYRIAQFDGAIPPLAERFEWKNEQSKKDYDCILRVHRLFVDESENSARDVGICISEQVKRGVPHADVYGLYAAVNYYVGNGYLIDGPPNPAENYAAAMKAGIAINPEDREILINELRDARSAQPPRADEITRITNLISTKLYDDPHLLNQAARAVGFGLGDWENAKNYAEQALAIVEENPLIANTAYAAAIATGDWESAQHYLAMFSYSEMENIAALNLATATHFGREMEIQLAINALRRTKIFTKADVEKFVRTFYVHPDLSGRLLTEIYKLPGDAFQ